MGNFFQDWTPSADDEEQRKLRAWQALAGDQSPHRTMANQVQLPEMDVVADPRADEVDMTPPPETARAPSDSRPVDMSDPPPPPPPPPSATARLGSMLSGRDQAPAPPESLPRDEPHSSGNDASPWAVLADVLLNKGRGVGGILAQGAAGKSDMRRAELDLKRAQAEHLRAPTDPELMAYKWAALGQGGERLGLARDNAQGVTTRFEEHRGDVNHIDSERNKTGVAMAGLKSGASTQARLDTENALIDRTAGNQAHIAGAEAAARIVAGHDLSPMTTADEAAKARAVGYAGNEPKLAYEQSMNPILSERSNTGMGQGLSAESLIRDNPGLDFSDPEQLQRAMKTRTINAQTLDKLQASNRAREILDSMYKTISDFQSGDKSPEAYYGASKQLDSHAQEYAGMMGRIAGAQNQEQVRADVARVPSLLNPYALTGVKKLWEAADANIRGNLGTLGIRARAPSFGERQQQQPTDADGGPAAPSINATNPTPSASPARGDYANYSRDTSDPPSLGKAPVPKIPTDAQRGTNISPRTVTKPDGTTKIENLSDEEAATLNARRGWSVK